MGFFSKKKTSSDEAPKPEIQNSIAVASLPQNMDSSAYGVVIGPHVTEKATNGSSNGAYAFRVTKDSTKISIKHAVKKLYNVDVKSVHVAHVRPKKRQVGRHIGVKTGYKKAIVTLKAGHKIDMISS